MEPLHINEGDFARDAVGLLDEDYFSYFEDTDYCFRVKERGLRVVCCGSVRVIHHEHVSTRVNGVQQSKVFAGAKQFFVVSGNRSCGRSGTHGRSVGIR